MFKYAFAAAMAASSPALALSVSDFCVGDPALTVTLTGNAAVTAGCEVLVDIGGTVTFSWDNPSTWGVRMLAADVTPAGGILGDGGVYYFEGENQGNDFGSNLFDAQVSFPSTFITFGILPVEPGDVGTPSILFSRFDVSNPVAAVPIPAGGLLLGAALIGLARVSYGRS